MIFKAQRRLRTWHPDLSIQAPPFSSLSVGCRLVAQMLGFWRIVPKISKAGLPRGEQRALLGSAREQSSPAGAVELHLTHLGFLIFFFLSCIPKHSYHFPVNCSLTVLYYILEILTAHSSEHIFCMEFYTAIHIFSLISLRWPHNRIESLLLAKGLMMQLWDLPPPLWRLSLHRCLISLLGKTSGGRG